MRELLDKRKQFVECSAVNDHRRVLGVHDNRVLIVIDIRRILESPRLVIHRHRHHAKILPRRVRNRARIADVFDAEQALGIPRHLFQLCRRNVSGVFLRLREVDRNFQFSIFCFRCPVLVLRNAVAADIVAVLTQLIEVVGRRFRTFRVERPELPHDLRRPRRDTTHQARVKQIALRNRVRNQTGFRRIVAEQIQAVRKIIALRLFFIAFQLQLGKQAVPRECFIQRMQQLTVLRIAQQRIERRIDTSYHI